MTGTVKIGSKEMAMAANAATPIFYRQIFHEDFISRLKDADEGAAVNVFTKAAFVMVKQAEGMATKDIMKLNEDHFIDWLMDFDAMDFVTAVPEISNIYLSQTEGTSIPKKKAE